MEEKAKRKLLLILYASQTGNAIDAAERLGREAERRGCPAAVLSVDEFDPVRTHFPLFFWFSFALFTCIYYYYGVMEYNCWIIIFLIMRKTFQISLPNEEIVVFVVSTTGQGDTPDSMKVKYVPLNLNILHCFVIE